MIITVVNQPSFTDWLDDEYPDGHKVMEVCYDSETTIYERRCLHEKRRITCLDDRR